MLPSLVTIHFYLKIKSMKNLTLICIGISLLVSISSCDKPKYDDDQYGNYCYVVKMAIKNGPVTSFAYDQDDQVYQVTTVGGGFPEFKMEVTYNNNMAFAEFYANNQYLGHTEAVLDSNYNVLSTANFDSTGADMGQETYIYNAYQELMQISGYEFFNNTSGTCNIEWNDGNPVRFTTSNGDVLLCQYNIGQKSSIRLGKGNVALLAQRAAPNIAMCFSRDLLRNFETSGSWGSQLTRLTYDLDDAGKAREIYWDGPAGSNTGTTEVQYECYE